MKQPIVKPLPNGRDWQLMENYVYACDDGRTVFVPAGFIFDFASIPRMFWRLFPPATGKHRTGALVHDWLCASGNVGWVDAADIFNEIMKKSGVNPVKRWIIYWAVRSFKFMHKPDPRQNRLKVLQRAELMQAKEYYSNVI